MQHKWQLNTSTIINTRRKNPQPHAIIVTFRAVVPELWSHRNLFPVAPPCWLDPKVPELVLEVIQNVIRGSEAKAVAFHVDVPYQGGSYVYFNSVTGRIEFPLGTTPKKVRAFEDKLRAAVDKFAAESDMPYHVGELV